MFKFNEKSFDENILKEEAQKNLKMFLDRQKESLSTFTRDPSIRYIGSKSLEKFLFKPKEGVLYLPLSTFLESNLDYNEILWHIYYEMALYPDWKENAITYLNREKDWGLEIDEITFYISKKIDEISKGSKPDEKFIRGYVKKEILDFLFQIDKYTSVLRVFETCPVYRDEEEIKKIKDYMKKTKLLNEIFFSFPHHGFTKSFFALTLYSDDEKISNKIKQKFDEKILSKSIYTFFNSELLKQINQDEGINKRDPFVKAFIYPSFKKYWLREIDGMDASENSDEEGKLFEEEKKQDTKNKLESNREDVEKTLGEILKQELNIAPSQEEFKNKIVDSHGLSKEEIELFKFYVDKTKNQREEMKEFWKKLIGYSKKEINVEKGGQPKGKLNVSDLIYNYTEFKEDEKKGNYKTLKIFDKNILESQNKLLPEKIEISFLLDNSGSMDKEKIDATRRTLVAILLSIEDFNEYLQVEANKTNQNIELLTETWFFGKSHYKLKRFDDTNEKARSEIISSITKLDASDGTTDDAACLRNIYKDISPYQKQRIVDKKEYKIIFEITDGASTFPGATKDIVKKLIEAEVEIYAFQIGKIKTIDTKTFNYIWNDSFKYPHGLILGEDIQRLTQELLKTVKMNFESIFRS
ncbi:vWA domain-containing protein [Lagierella massiliensis]|uniref:vWA domain-containing protein n=1 Tax=Lagierella massiliensis TaxID=1689303 RepID=UPI0006D7EE0E|nr:vWA domain-containing protein [Lagierella massiliensis]